jgi:ATP-dependent exoDNAse (exonuclease V) alpha subunit
VPRGPGGYGQDADHRRGLAVSAVAAEVLAFETGVAADTVAKFLYEHDRRNGAGEQWRLSFGEVVIVDEASQLASADLLRLVQLIEEVHGKIVLVGDHRQLGAVDAGGLFRLLVNDTNAAELTGVHRFTNRWERDATIALRRGDVHVLDDYEVHDRFRQVSRELMLDVANQAWADARAKGVSMTVMAADHTTVDEFAMRVRAGRVAAGQVEPGGIEAGDQTIGAGDEIVTLHNDRRLVTNDQHWVRNGDRWRVQRRTRRGGLHAASLEGRGHIYLPPAYAAEHVALAYAVTPSTKPRA